MKTLIISLLAVLIIAPAVQAVTFGLPENPQVVYAQTVSYNGTLAHGADAWAYVQSASGWGPVGERYLIECNFAGLIASDYPGFSVADAKFELNLAGNYGSAAGVRAYAITPAASGFGSGIYSAADWGSAGTDLGWFVAPGDAGTGLRTLDVTAALQAALDAYVIAAAVPGFNSVTDGKPFFAIRLQTDDGSGAYEVGGGIYVFNEGDDGQPPWAPYGFSATITDVVIPEPSVMAIGLVALLGLRRKK